MDLVGTVVIRETNLTFIFVLLEHSNASVHQSEQALQSYNVILTQYKLFKLINSALQINTHEL